MKVEQLRAAREESANVAYQTFVQHIRSDKLGLYCFFEGKDSPYYFHRVKPTFTGSCHPITCSGKSKVLKVYELINSHREYDKYKKAFFVDRDFDPSLENAQIYETPCYSIENLYIHESVFADILKSEFGLTEAEEGFDKCVKIYQDLQNSFHQATTLLNSWYACLIHIRNTSKHNIGVILEENIPKEFITISLDGITSNYDINSIKAKYPNALEVDSKSLELKQIEFESQDKGRIFRGKFAFSFMLKVLDQLIEDSKTNQKFISKKIKYHITKTQAISQFSQYAETPDDLLDYIRKIIG